MHIFDFRGILTAHYMLNDACYFENFPMDRIKILAIM